ncbi:MAG: GNAT family N-acetyltransferase [Corynebacteriales bacterium]|nr:GNAT family N-acetyltransferase [Mycobacteriales bacterium]
MKSELRVRPAEPKDSAAIWKWRNDPATRAASVNTDEVCWADHQGWYDRTLASEERFLLIGEFEGEAVGVVRFDATESDTWEISINMAPSARGKRLSVPLLNAGHAWLVDTFGPQSVTALIRVENSASLRAFENAGYVLATKDAEYVTMHKN